MDHSFFQLSFSLSLQPLSEKIGVISDFYLSSNWDLHLRRNIRDDELPQLSSLFFILTHFHPSPFHPNSMFWSLASSGSFSVSSLYAASPPLPLTFLFQTNLVSVSFFKNSRFSMKSNLKKSTYPR